MDDMDRKVQAFVELHRLLTDPYFDGENIKEMTAEQLRDFARRRYERAQTEEERDQVSEDNEMLCMLAMAREAKS